VCFKVAKNDIVLGEIDDEIVSYIRLDPIWSKVPYIGLIWVKKEFRGKGLGKSILSWLEEKLKDKGEKVIFSSSQEDESEPQEWHLKAGFSRSGEILGINEGDVAEVFFRKGLT
jgi:predicted GNAT family N-acyltransferase